MARTTSRVDGDRSVLIVTDKAPIILDTPTWFAWLESATVFAFTCSLGSFTARKEGRERGGWYWKAYHKADGILHRVYLGKSSDLTLDRLNSAAATMRAATNHNPPSTLTPSSGATTIQPPNLLATKLIVPPARAQLVVREHLFERLDFGLLGKLTLVSAPAGFGKTTLVSAWRTTTSGSSIPFAWVSLDSGDNDPLLFWTYLLVALDTVVPGVGTVALSLFHSPQPPSIDHLLTTMLNAFNELQSDKEGRGVILVLEDYHVISNQSIHVALAWLLDCLPASLHLVIITRADPPLPLARLRVNGNLTELHADDLRFTLEEVAAFLNQIMGLALTPDDLAALEVRTEGWIAGLQLAALALRDHRDRASFIRTFTGNNRYIVDYLAAEVFERQPPHIQTFLLHTSILNRMCSSLCDALLDLGAEEEHTTNQSILEELERANLFVIPLDEERHWYRYHHLFADVLQQRLARTATGSNIATLHERCSIWYEQQGLGAEAVQHALKMTDKQRATQLIEQQGLNIIVGGQVQTVLGWMSKLPEDLLRTRPRLCIIHSCALLFTNNLSGAEVWLKEAENCLNPDIPTPDTQITQGNVAAIRANIALYTGDIAACVSYGEQVLHLLPETEVIARTMAQLHLARAFRFTGDVTVASERRVNAAIAPIRATGNLLGTLGAVINRARLYELQGRLRTAAATYHELVQIANGSEALRGLHGALPYYVGLGNLHREWNELKIAEEYLTQALELQLGTGTVDAGYVTLGYLSLARLQHARREQTNAQETLATFADLAQQRGIAPHLLKQAAAVAALFALNSGNIQAAVIWAEASGLQADDAIAFPREVEYLVLVRLWIAQSLNGYAGDFLPSALLLLERLLADATAKGRQASVLEILILQALVLKAQGNLSDALKTLVRALVLAAPEGYIRSFVDEGMAMRELLQRVEPRILPSAPHYVPSLLSAFASEQDTIAETRPTQTGTLPVPTTFSSPNSLFNEPLTEREREVLRLIANGQSNAEVAVALVIALSTVKTHTNSIFSKLGVTSRTQAIVRARELQIL